MCECEISVPKMQLPTITHKFYMTHFHDCLISAIAIVFISESSFLFRVEKEMGFHLISVKLRSFPMQLEFSMNADIFREPRKY